MITYLAAIVVSLIARDERRMVTASTEATILSERSGKTIRISPKLGSEILFLASGGASVDMEVNAVAYALHASVVHEKDQLVIRRTQADTANLERARADQRVQWIQKTLDRVARFRELHTRSGPPWQTITSEIKSEWQAWTDFASHKGPFPQNVFVARHLLPSEQLLEGLIRRISPATLASLPSGENYAFESEPSRPDRGLPDVSDLLQIYASSMQEFAGYTLDDDLQKKIGAYAGLEVLASDARRNDPPTYLRLKVQAISMAMGIGLELYDKDGNKLDEANLQVTPKDEILTSKQIADSTMDPPGLDRYPLSSDELNAAAFARYENLREMPVWFTAPDKFEPLSLMTKSAMSALADEEDAKCFVADVPDSFFGYAGESVKNSKLNIESFKKIIHEWEGYERAAIGQAVIWRPTDPQLVESSRTDRRGLGSYAREFLSEQSIPHRLQGKLYQEAFPGRWQLRGLWLSGARAFLHEVRIGDDLTERSYAFVGAISDADWDRLKSGEVISLGQLGSTAEFQAVLDEDIVQAKSAAPLPDLLRHPAELFKGYDLSQAPVTMQLSNVPVARYWNADGPEFKLWQPAANLEGLFHIIATPEQTPRILTSRDEFEAKMTKQFKFRFATEEYMNLEIGGSHGSYVEARVPGTPASLSEVQTFADFPEQVKDQIWKKVCAEAIEGGRETWSRMNSPAAASNNSGINQPHPLGNIR